MERVTIDLLVLEKFPEQLAKVTVALAEAYFNNVLDPHIDTNDVSQAYGKAFKLCPNYRLTLQKARGYEKFRHLIPELAEISAIPITPAPSAD